MNNITDDMFLTLSGAIDSFKTDLDEMIKSGTKEGTECPCCNKVYKVYQKNISSRVALTLADMYRDSKLDWIHLPSTKRTACQNYQDLRFWGLIEEGTNHNRIGGKNSGYWRVTDFGRSFIKGHVLIPKYAHIFKSEKMGYSGDLINFSDCFKDGFDFNEFMGRCNEPELES